MTATSSARRDKLLRKLPYHGREAADLGERTKLWSDEEDLAVLVRVVDSLSEHRSDAARRIMKRAMLAGLDLCAPLLGSSVLGTWRVVKKRDS